MDTTKSRYRRFGMRSRCTRAGWQKLRSRRLGLEALESRQMLSHSPIEFNPPGLPQDSGVGQHELPPGLVSVEQTHWINGQPFTVVADPAPAGPVNSGESGSLTHGALHPLSSLPQLSSNPAAVAKLYLDFNGHFEPDTSGGAGTTTPVYDLDDDPTTFSDRELSYIQLGFQKVAEDFAPFNIDVTTIEPPELAAGVPESVANGVALRVAIGGFSAGLGGVATIGSFTNSAANVAYVFPRSFSQSFVTSQDSLGDLISHEAGHAFGLSHQSTYDQNGNLIDTYNHGSDGWAPLMGYGYIPVTTWYNGTSSSATTYQDDMAILANAVNGFGYRADDVGDSIATASPLAFDGVANSGSGIIGTNSDVDAWSFSIATSDTYRIKVTSAEFGPNLDAVLELRDAAGSLIASASPALSQAAELLLSLTPAQYFVTVTKTAAYGWLGAYTVNVAAPPAGITVSGRSPLVSREGGLETTFTVVLDTPPISDVLIPLSSSNTAEATLSTASVLFTPTNWNVPQVVSVLGLDDGIADGDVPYSLFLGPAISSDTEYSGLDATDLAAVNLDNSFGGLLYWVDSINDTVVRSMPNGNGVQTIVDLKALYGGDGSSYGLRYLDVDLSGGKLYWTDSGANRIQRSNLDGSNIETLVSGFTGGGLRGIAVDSAAGKIYWADFAAQKIQRANLDGTNVEDLVSGGLSGVRGLTIDPIGGKMYWADIDSDNIRRANLDGSDIEILWTGKTADAPSGIVLDPIHGKMYWSEYGDNRILRANLDGTNVEEVVNLQALFEEAGIISLAVDASAGKLYFCDVYNRLIYRANLDGSNIVAVVSEGIGSVQGLAFVRPDVAVVPSAGLLTNESGIAVTFQVTLTAPPKANVTIPISSSDTTEGTVSVSSLVFTPTNWKVPQTITVTGVNDTIFDGDVAYSVVLGAATSADPDYAGFDPRDVSLTNLDNEVKFYVVNDATANTNYKYGADGSARGSTALATANAAPRGAASTILGDKTWVIDANRNVYVYRNSDGALLGSWAAGSMPSNATPEGIATNGIDVWIVDSRGDKVYRYAGAATLLAGSQTAASSFSLNSGNTSPKDIVTDGSSFWVVNDTSKTDKVFKYSLSGGLQGSWTIDAANKAPTGITVDPANVSHIWIVDSGTDRVYQYSDAATRTSGSQSATVLFALATGNTNPQGIADPPPSDTIPVGYQPLSHLQIGSENSAIVVRELQNSFVTFDFLGRTGTNSARNITFDSGGRRYVGGHFEGDAASPQGTIASVGGIDSYVTRLAQPTSMSAMTNVSLTTDSQLSTSANAEPGNVSQASFLAVDNAFADFEKELLLLMAR